jgi:hypothetical protein
MWRHGPFPSRRTLLWLLMRSHSELGDRYDRPNENERAADWGYARHHFPSLWLPHLNQPTYRPYDEPSYPREEAQMVSSHATLQVCTNGRRSPWLRPMRCTASTMSASGLPQGSAAYPASSLLKRYHTALPWQPSYRSDKIQSEMPDDVGRTDHRPVLGGSDPSIGIAIESRRIIQSLIVGHFWPDLDLRREPVLPAETEG